MRRLKLLPVLGGVPSWHVFPQADQQLQVAMEQGHAVALARERVEALGRRIPDVAELETPVTGEEDDLLAEILRRRQGVDAILVQLSTVLDSRLWAIDAPILAWSGDRNAYDGPLQPPVRSQYPSATSKELISDPKGADLGGDAYPAGPGTRR